MKCLYLNDNSMKIKVFKAAGGNQTAIISCSDVTREKYSELNKDLQNDYREIEQVGFWEEKDGVPFLQMAGGEFCGNATRAFACFLKDEEPEKNEFCFKVSGYSGKIFSIVEDIGNNKYYCAVRFPNFLNTIKIIEKKYKKNLVRIVNLGGIVHILLDEGSYKFPRENYELFMKKLKNDLKVDCGAVGVVWFYKKNKKIYIKPVVWVKSIDTCFYETSCGSASIAIGLIYREDASVIQPTNEEIKVGFEGSAILLSSKMEKTMEL